MAKNAREGLSENYFWECDGETGASLWSIFDTIWVTLMDKKEPISPELFKKYPIVEREID